MLGTEWEFVGGGGGGGGYAGYVISMGLEYFQKFLDKPMQREGVNIFFENSISPLRLSRLIPFKLGGGGGGIHSSLGFLSLSSQISTEQLQTFCA